MSAVGSILAKVSVQPGPDPEGPVNPALQDNNPTPVLRRLVTHLAQLLPSV